LCTFLFSALFHSHAGGLFSHAHPRTFAFQLPFYDSLLVAFRLHVRTRCYSAVIFSFYIYVARLRTRRMCGSHALALLRTRFSCAIAARRNLALCCPNIRHDLALRVRRFRLFKLLPAFRVKTVPTLTVVLPVCLRLLFYVFGILLSPYSHSRPI
jgi:hypothetical protein